MTHRSAAAAAIPGRSVSLTLVSLSLALVGVLGLVRCGGGQAGTSPLSDGSASGDGAVDAMSNGDAPPETSLRDAPSEGAHDATEGTFDGGADVGSDTAALEPDGGCSIDAVSGEPTELRCTGLYSDWTTRTVASDVTEYSPGLVLWSDGAAKTRWVYLPPGQKIDTSDMDEWVFPVGTRFWKQFVVSGVFTETRMLHKQSPSGWSLVTYRWAPDLSSATLSAGALNVNDAGYEIPTHQKCVQCHQGRVDYILGFEAISLASPQASGMTLSDLTARNLITGAPAATLTVPGNAVESAALGYLHANCGTACHNPNRGLAQMTGFFLRLNVAELGSVTATDAYQTGWDHPTMTTQFLSAGVTGRLVACSPGASCVYYRASHRDGVDAPTGTQMPPIDTHAADPSGLAAIAAWLNEGCVSDGGEDARSGSDAASDASSDH